MQQKTWSNDVCLLRYGMWHNFLSFQVIYCSFTPLLTWKIKIWKNVKNTLRYYPFTYVHHKSRSYNVWFLIYKVERTKFFVILDHFVCPLTLLTTQKTKILKKIKNTWRYYHFTLVYHKWQWRCMVSDILSSMTDRIFCHFGLFLPFYPPNNPEN